MVNTISLANARNLYLTLRKTNSYTYYYTSYWHTHSHISIILLLKYITLMARHTVENHVDYLKVDIHFI